MRSVRKRGSSRRSEFPAAPLDDPKRGQDRAERQPVEQGNGIAVERDGVVECKPAEAQGGGQNECDCDLFHRALARRVRAAYGCERDHRKGQRIEWVGRALMQLGAELSGAVAIV